MLLLLNVNVMLLNVMPLLCATATYVGVVIGHGVECVPLMHLRLMHRSRTCAPMNGVQQPDNSASSVFHAKKRRQ